MWINRPFSFIMEAMRPFNPIPPKGSLTKDETMIKIVEVGPRDGLQNETVLIPTPAKVAFVDALSTTGVGEIEVSAFVSPQWVPQLSDAAQVFKQIRRNPDVIYSALVPNSQGMDRALKSGVDKVSVFTAASQTFNRKNINTTIKGSLERFKPVLKKAQARNLPVRAYVSTAFWCPFEGQIPPEDVRILCLDLLDMGIDELSISDTIGKASPRDVADLLDHILPDIPAHCIAAHFHDTYGTGLANVLESIGHGINTLDASTGGLGGCPYAPGATGNVATEEVVQALVKAGHITHVDPAGLRKASRILMPHIRTNPPTPPRDDSLACSTCEFSNDDRCKK